MTDPAPAPPPRRRTQAERVEESGRRLLTAAAELIAEKGWEATTAAEIGRRAGYSRAMVHARFGSKDALLDALLRSEYEERLSPGEAPASTSGLERVLMILDRMRTLHDEDPAFLASMFAVSFQAVNHSPVLRPRITAWIRRIAEAAEAGLRAGIADGSVRGDLDVDQAVADLIATGTGTAYGWLVVPERFDLARQLTVWRERCLRDLGTGAPPSPLD
ncbi:MAG: TetR/AcrR family transcriptional regulator [Solirubrobacteraceae bacterium]|nr:TetR/AcrR family transcriptional regulator [Solirubrobacteraceae bacterium]